MSVIYIEGKKFQVNRFSNLLEVCLSFGFDIPYFCWHPVLGSVGSCRQCAVRQYQNFSDNYGSIVMSCMTPISDGALISIFDDEVKEFRKNILELLMINHPHDCPVCSEGGNCHLQDMTVMAGHHLRRYRFMKRTHFNQDLGPFILHEMNRCINCYRCVRYYKDYSGGYDFGVYGVHDNLYFGRFQDGKLESEFSGNLIEICPTGVFTDKTSSQSYSRKWDIQFSPSICVHCSVGCNVTLGERYGKLCRVENRYNADVNGYFLCDRGRFGYDYVNNINHRFITPVMKMENTSWMELDEKGAIRIGVNMLRDSDRIIGIGSTRASIESNFALRTLVGAENFFIGINRLEHRLLFLVLNILQNSGIHTPSIKEIESCDAILLLGEDITQTSPRIALAIRQAVKGSIRELARKRDIPYWNMNAVMSLGECGKNPLFITSIDITKLDDMSSWTYYASLDDQARFGFAVAHILDNSSPEVDNFDSELMDKAKMVAKELLKASKPLIISGTSIGSEAVLSSAANIVKALKNCGKDVNISLVTSDVNSIGLAMIGGGSLDDVLDLVNQNSKVDSLIVLENDLYRHIFSEFIDDILRKIKYLIVLDHQKFLFHNKADLIFSSASIPESDGTLINQEGRAQRFFRVYNPNYYDSSAVILDSWRWLHLLYSVLHSDSKIENLKFDSVVDKVIYSLPNLSKMRLASSDASFRVVGQKLARAPHRWSGRTSMYANIDVHEPRVCQDKDSMFTFSMEGCSSFLYRFSEHVAFAWLPGWNSCQVWNKFYSERENLSFQNNFGVCFFDSTSMNKKNIDWFVDVPILFSSNTAIGNDIWYIVPYYHIFGSEEMSQRSLVIKSCMSEVYVVFNRLDAIKFNFEDKKNVMFQCGKRSLSFPMVLSDRLVSGCIGLPVGFPGIPLSYLGMCVKNIRGIF